MEQGYSMLECFPFDSSPELTYDEWGYPRYDRAADARVLRETFAKFFSDGVFPSPATALNISKGKGLSVEIAPGGFVLNGAMGCIQGEPLVVELDIEPPKGKVCYGIMLRFDNRRTHRALFVRVAKSEPSANPTPPEPERGVDFMEMRLGHVTVPSQASDLAGATVVNEKGLAACPYAAPFEDLDMEAVVLDARARAFEELKEFGAEMDAAAAEADSATRRLQEFIARNKAALDAALDGTAVGHLQGQIDELRESGSIEGAIDPRYFEMASPSPDQQKKLAVAASAIGARELKPSCVTGEKVADGALTLAKFSPGAVDAAGGVASADSVADVLNDLLQLAFNFHFAQLDALDMDAVVKWGFPDDASAESGTWSGSYYYADKGVA